MSKTKQTFGGVLVLLGLLAMVSIEPGQAIGPYVAVMAAALAAVVAGARLGGWIVATAEASQKSAAGDGSPTSGTRK